MDRDGEIEKVGGLQRRFNTCMQMHSGYVRLKPGQPMILTSAWSSTMPSWGGRFSLFTPLVFVY